MRCPTSTSPRGFTVLELMTAVAIAGVIGSLAVVASADTIIDARARAEARVVVERLRAEHRAAREQRVGLKVTSAERSVTYQHTRGPGCTQPVGDARVVTYDAASLVIASPEEGACFNLRGEPEPMQASVIIVPQSPSAVSTAVQAPGEQLLLSVAAPLTGGDAWLLPLRIDRAGIADLQSERVADPTPEVITALLVNKTEVIRGEVDFTPPPPESASGGGTSVQDPINTITDPCLKFVPTDPLVDCTTVQVN